MTSSNNLLRSKAPLRISFCGGGTDVAPYPERFGGCVLSCTINKYAYVSVRSRSDEEVCVKSLDYGMDVQYQPRNGMPDDRLSLVDAIIKRFHAHGVDLFVHSDAPPGSGLGSSSTMIVALSAALARFGGTEMERYDLARLAYEIEREDLRIIGGLQDQYAASFGGFNFIEFDGQSVIVNPLRLSSELLNELHYHLVLCYTGGTRLSSNIVQAQTRSVEHSEAQVLHSLHEMKRMAVELKNELLRGKIREFGMILHEAWLCKQNLAKGITNERIDALYENARNAGAWGGKILGAGGGGYLLLCTPFSKRHKVIEALEGAGGKVVDFQFEHDGVRTWTALENTWID